MNRRTFLKRLVGTAAAVAVPELIYPERRFWQLDKTMVTSRDDIHEFIKAMEPHDTTFTPLRGDFHYNFPQRFVVNDNIPDGEIYIFDRPLDSDERHELLTFRGEKMAGRIINFDTNLESYPEYVWDRESYDARIARARAQLERDVETFRMHQQALEEAKNLNWFRDAMQKEERRIKKDLEMAIFGTDFPVELPKEEVFPKGYRSFLEQKLGVK